MQSFSILLDYNTHNSLGGVAVCRILGDVVQINTQIHTPGYITPLLTEKFQILHIPSSDHYNHWIIVLLP